MAVDYYELLGVSEDASADEIKRAFRALARELHPDATGGDDDAQERYKQISEAYSVLSDPEKRQRYDMARAGVGPFGFGATTIEDIFESFFGGAGGVRARTRSPGRRGESVEVEMPLTFRETVFGAQKFVKFTRLEPCDTCDGSGAAPGTAPERCGVCDGTGQVQQARRTMLGSLVTAHPCRACGQTGWVISEPCPECDGAARVPVDVEIPIEVPAGIGHGDRLRLTGEGEAGTVGGGRGDLYVRFLVEPDDRFVRSGEDLVTWAAVPVTTAALGGEVRFESLDGEERLDIPRGTQSGERFRIRGRGFPRGHGRGRGDLVVRVHVLTPTDLDRRQEELLRELASERGEDATGEGILSTLRRALGFD